MTKSNQSNQYFSQYGFILFLPYTQGSKSNSYRPVLAIGHGTTLTLYRKGDNPFSNESIISFHGKYCYVEGKLDRERKLIEVILIEEADDPFSAEFNMINNATVKDGESG